MANEYVNGYEQRKYELEKALSSDSGHAQLAMAAKIYYLSIKLPTKFNCAGAGQDYLKKCKDIDFYKEIKLEDGTTLGAHSKNAEINTLLKNDLKPTSETEKAVTEFKQKISHLQTVLAEEPRVYTSEAFTDALVEIRQEALKTLVAEQEKELTKVEDYFKIPSTLLNALGININQKEQLEALKTQFMDGLKKNHETQKKAFEAPINADIAAFKEAYKNGLLRVAQLAKLRHTAEPSDYNKYKRYLIDATRLDMGVQKEIKEHITEKNKNKIEPDTVARANNNPEDEDFGFKPDDLRNLNFDDLKEKQTLTGRGYNFKKTKGPKGEEMCECEMEIPAQWFYMPYNNEDLGKDLYDVFTNIRLAGFDSIKITIRQENQKTLNEQIGIACESAIKAGFDIDKISIVIMEDGKEKTIKGSEVKGNYLTLEKFDAAIQGQEEKKQAIENIVNRHAKPEENLSIKTRLDTMKQDEDAKNAAINNGQIAPP